jgi:dihydrofolate reductase
MRTLTLWMQVSLDGFTSGPNGEFDWPIVDEQLHRYFIDELRPMDAFLYGRKVYEMMAYFWPTADTSPASTPAQVEYAQLWKPMPKVVFSTTLDGADWNTRVVGDKLVEEVTALKQQPGHGLVLFGGADIAATFMRHDLIDEFRLFVHPVVLGGGTPLFPTAEQRRNLQLVQARTFDSAVVHLHHRRSDAARSAG